MSFVGEVNITLYWGTRYDRVNVPLHSQQIISDATRSLDLPGYIVWQTTWLTSIRINMEDYQDIVGVQYARITDVGTANQGAHWFDVLDYQQVSQGCVELGLRYDTLLTIPISTWKTCTGLLKRWTPDSDAPYQYASTPEPIDFAEPLSITWQVVQPVTLISNTHLVGCPYDMTQAPEVITYTNPNGTETNVYYPKLEPPDDKKTVFLSGLGTDQAGATAPFSDGMQYSVWGPGAIAYRTYNAAISLGIDMVVNGYIVPSSWVQYTADPGTGYAKQISGIKQQYPGTLPLYATGYNNAKAGSINTTFTLASCASGDSVTVNNFQLSDGSVTVYSDPYSTGGMRARFTSYMNEQIGSAGWVKSPSWQPLSVTSGAGFGVARDAISNTMSADTLALNVNQRHATEQLTRSQARDSYLFNTATGAVSTVGNVLQQSIGDLNIIGAVNAAVNGVIDAAGKSLDYTQSYARLNQLAEQADATANHQAAMLSYQGNVGRMAPPSVKYSHAYDITHLTYAFTVMRAGPSARDMQRLDRFFTAYGYNVDNATLNTPAQLRARQRFTFVQADDVRVLSTIYSDTNQRIGDAQTTADIQSRFAAGVRIWRVTPDFDYSSPNHIATGG